MQTVMSLLRLRLEDSARTTLRDVVSGSPALRRLSEPLSRRLVRHAGDIRIELSSAPARLALANSMSSGFLRYLFARYQYVRPSAKDRSALFDAYRSMTEALARAGASTDIVATVGECVRIHHDRLQAITTHMLAEVGAIDDVLDGADPICREYSPELQCDILGLAEDDLAGPLLDLGCGETGELVEFLRLRGCAAWGLDRLASDSAHRVCGDWFCLPGINGGWQTVIAHMSFSLHFVHAHLHSDREAQSYAVAYMDILGKLGPGGSFIYAPGLPFIEPLLDSHRFRVETRPIRMPGSATVSASRVTRL